MQIGEPKHKMIVSFWWQAFIARGLLCSKSPKNENGRGKGESNFLYKETHYVILICILLPTYQTFLYHYMIMIKFSCNLGSYGKIMEHKQFVLIFRIWLRDFVYKLSVFLWCLLHFLLGGCLCSFYMLES